MEDLNDIYFFASIVRYGGFSAAARTIGVEKTRLSRRISALEKRLGVRLLQRTTRALALTEAGQRFFEPEIVVVLFVSKPLPERRSSLEPVLRVSKKPSPTQGKSDSSGRY